MRRFCRLTAVILCLALMMQIAALPAVADEVGEIADGIAMLANGGVIASGYCGGEGDGTNLSWVLTKDGVLTICGSGEMDNWIDIWDFSKSAPWHSRRDLICSVVFDGDITSIGSYAFSDCICLTTIDIPSGVTSIGSSAFYSCTKLAEVEIPSRVTRIGDYAFFSCTDLTKINIPKSVTMMGANPFAGCKGIISAVVDADNPEFCSVDNILFTRDMKRIISYPSSNQAISYCIPNGVTDIGDYAFYRCGGLTSVTVPNGTVRIGDNAFEKTNLDSMIIPDSVTTIGKWAFYDCKMLKTIELPDSVIAIGSHAFSACGNIKSIRIPNYLTSISESLFEGCTGLTSIVIPDNVKNIDRHAFYRCDKLASVSIPNSVEGIADYAFGYCIKLISITIPNSVEYMGGRVFANCESLANIFCEMEKTPIYWHDDWNGSLAIVHWGEKSGENNFPDNVIDCGYCGGEGNGTNLIWFITENNVLTICGDGDMKDYASHLGTPAPWIEYAGSIVSVVFDGNVANIGDWAFTSFSSMLSINIPNTVKSIGSYAFSSCYLITSVEIPSGVTKIKDGAFYDCLGLCSIEIPDSVTNIYDGAFHGCINLTKITISSGNKNYCVVDDVLFSKDKSSIVCYPAGNQNELFVIPDHVTNICGFAFDSCDSLTSIFIPDGVRFIGQSSFNKCSGLTSVEIPDGVTSVGKSAFGYCTSLISIWIPSSVASIGDFTFEGCTRLTSVTIPNSVTSIGWSAFCGCTGLTDIYCELENKPDGWNDDWNYMCSATIHWGYKPLYGDLDGDGKIDESETTTVLDIVKGINNLTAQLLNSADFNKDGKIDIRDFNYIYNKVMSK